MGNLLSRSSKRSSSDSRTSVGRGSSSVTGGPPRSLSSSFSNYPFEKLPHRNQNHSYSYSSASTAAGKSETEFTSGSTGGMATTSSGRLKKKYGYIPDNFTSIDQVLLIHFLSGQLSFSYFAYASLFSLLNCVCPGW